MGSFHFVLMNIFAGRLSSLLLQIEHGARRLKASISRQWQSCVNTTRTCLAQVPQAHLSRSLLCSGLSKPSLQARPWYRNCFA